MEITAQFSPLWPSNNMRMLLLENDLLARIDHRGGLAIYRLHGESPFFDSCETVGYYAFDWGSPVDMAFSYPYVYAAGQSTVSVFDVRPLYGDTLSVSDSVLPMDYALEQPFPNPFNAQTRLQFVLPRAGEVSLGIFDLNGRLVETLSSGVMTAGAHTVSWNAEGLPSGVYLARLERAGEIRLRTLTLVR